MQVVSRAKRKIAILLLVLTVGITAAGCLSDNIGAVGPPDPTKNAIFREMNARRRAAGLPEFGYSERLDFDGHLWAAIMSQGAGFRHQDLNALLNNPDHGAYWTLGENIMTLPWYLAGPKVIVDLFMNSPPHRANILSRNFNVVGVGMVTDPWGTTWVSIVFGGI